MRRNHIIKHTCIAWSLILGLASCGDEIFKMLIPWMQNRLR